ncbi:MAG: twin-arginine translocation signal domain-containing protein [Niabella sp.]
MQSPNSRRNFIKLSTLSGLGLGLSSTMPSLAYEIFKQDNGAAFFVSGKNPDIPFVPRRVASWWNTIEDLQWNQKSIRDKVKRRAEGFARANIDTAMNYGFHVRFDFANYFGRLNEYFAAVKEELHKYDIKFIEHYSCNHVERPRGKEEFDKLHRNQRHHVLLYHDEIAAKHAQYEGHLFHDICEVDIIDGSRGYSRQYQMEAFCHNNPNFLDMHKKYLQRLIREVDFDGYEIDDMCDYVGLRTCGCKYCRERFKKDYGREIPPTSDKSFWGDMTKPMLYWGDYESPVFRDWKKMKDDVIDDHVQMCKDVIGNKPILTCCSSTGPIVLNSISLNLERIADKLDFYMLENVGTNIRSVAWLEKDAEAMQQKDIAEQRGFAPPMALSYTIFKDGGYLGWALARYWGVANWASTFQHRLVEDPPNSLEVEDMIAPVNNWEVKHSNLDYYKSNDFEEVRLVYNYYCRMNGWKDENGVEQWSKVKTWSKQLAQSNVSYRFVRYKELADEKKLCSSNTPLILDSVACLSDAQYNAIRKYLIKGGEAWLTLPFGTHDEKGFKRNVPLSEKLLQKKYKRLHIISTSSNTNPIEELIKKEKFIPIIKQIAGGQGWCVRARKYGNKIVLHILNGRMKAIPHPTIKDISGLPVITSIESTIANNNLVFEIDSERLPVTNLSLYSPELEDSKKTIIIERKGKKQVLKINLSKIRIYAVAQ